MFIELLKGCLVEKASIVLIRKTLVPVSDLVNAGKPCVMVIYRCGNETSTITCHSTDSAVIDQHYDWIISQFDVIRLPANSSF